MAACSFGCAYIAEQGVIHLVGMEDLVEGPRCDDHVLKEPNSLTLGKMV